MSNRKNINLFYIPIWVLDKAKHLNLTVADLLDAEKIVNTLSKTDVDKYIAESRTIYCEFKIPTVMDPRPFFTDSTDIKYINLWNYLSDLVHIRIPDIPWQYQESSSKTNDCSLDTAAHVYRKEDGEKPQFELMPDLLYVDADTIVMTIRRVDSADTIPVIVENSIDTLITVGYELSDILNTPYGRYLLSRSVNLRTNLK